ncbi:uncharacterized protein LOC119349951 [Triticum dicoccoides]|uniref:uncharacterized protein LOC119349951 n=1 Tax=Triticum dicoccoides TaxID=85692 RepID=UPI00188EC80C|nr:uncharacterized protein LOC119349951 [Triticum dicoccoides]
MEGSVDWSKIEIAPMNDEEIDVPITEENMCSVLGINDEPEHRKIVSEAAMKASIADVDACVADIDEDLLADAALPVPDHMPEEDHFWYDKEHPVIEEGSLFRSMNEIRMLMRTFAIRGKFDIKTKDSDTTRFVGHCKGNACPWRITARTIEDGKTVRVNKIVKPHKCSSTAAVITSMADQAWVAEKAMGYLQTEPNIGASELRKKLQAEYKCTIGYHTVDKGKERAKNSLYGTWGKSFQSLLNFKAEIDKRSPGSIVEVDVKREGGEVHFRRFFMALKPCIDGFLAGCRPYVSIDSTFLTGKWNGQLAACTALDGQNWMFPLAFGFFGTETEGNWIWFMQQLHRAIGHLQTLAICTDACKGLENAVKIVFPQAEQRECFRHLMANFKKKFHGDVFGRMWPAAKAYHLETFNYHMGKIFEAEPAVSTYLCTYQNLKWMRCDFNTEIKCDYIHNNLAECFNSWIKGTKEMPMDELADAIREKIMILVYRRRRIGEMLQGEILPAIIQQINNRTRQLDHLVVGRSTGESCEVKDTSKNNLRHVVKIGSRECTCLEWQHTGKPCEHALAFLIETADVNFQPYVHEYYSVSRFRAAYAGEIEPITDKSQWPHVNLDFEMVPPDLKSSVGRRRKQRIKSCLEDGGGSKRKKKDDNGKTNDQEGGDKEKEKEKKRFGSRNRCKECGILGHRKATCKKNEAKER